MTSENRPPLERNRRLTRTTKRTPRMRRPDLCEVSGAIMKNLDSVSCCSEVYTARYQHWPTDSETYTHDGWNDDSRRGLLAVVERAFGRLRILHWKAGVEPKRLAPAKLVPTLLDTGHRRKQSIRKQSRPSPASKHYEKKERSRRDW